MADEPAHSLAEESATATTRRGVDALSREFAGPGFAERTLRPQAGSYASSVHPIQARLAAVFALARFQPPAEWR
jgi:hypothetical protein